MDNFLLPHDKKKQEPTTSQREVPAEKHIYYQTN